MCVIVVGQWDRRGTPQLHQHGGDGDQEVQRCAWAITPMKTVIIYNSVSMFFYFEDLLFSTNQSLCAEVEELLQLDDARS